MNQRRAEFGRALVLGLGGSGVAAAELLLGEGTEVTVADASDSDGLRRQAQRLTGQGARVQLGCSDLPGEAYDVCVCSPGIAAASDWVRGLEARGIPVISELELGALRCRCPMLAITGSKGKSTLVKLCCESLQAAGRRAEPAGNYGPALCSVALRSGELDWIVVEVSSFQLERTVEFHPRVAILLNVQPDHLDRHGDLDTYARTKVRIFERMQSGDTAIVRDEDLERVRGWRQDPATPAGGSGPAWQTFGRSNAAGFRYEQGQIRHGTRTISVAGTGFANDILGPAAAAAAAALNACGESPVAVQRAAQAFKPLPHRMSLIAEIRGVRYVDDSKATSLTALAAALTMEARPVRLIAGGLLKEYDLESLKELLTSRVRCVYLIGKATERMMAVWSSAVPCRSCGTLEQAVKEAGQDALDGETVLLSPACASFDQFRNFEDRGEQFARWVQRMAERAESTI